MEITNTVFKKNKKHGILALFFYLISFLSPAQVTPPSWLWVNSGTSTGNYSYTAALAIDTVTSNAVYWGGRFGSGSVSFTSQPPGSTINTSFGCSSQLGTAQITTPVGVTKWVTSVPCYGQDYGDGVGADNSGNSYISGLTQGGDNPYISQINSAGTNTWSYEEGSFEGRSYGVDADRVSGNVYVETESDGGGTLGGFPVPFSGSAQSTLAKYNSSGTCLWVRTSTGGSYNAGRRVSVDPKGNHIYVTGGYSGGSPTFGSISTPATVGFSNLFIADYDPNGNCLGVAIATSAGIDNGAYYEEMAVASDANHNAYVTGHFQGTATFGNLSVTSVGSNDILTAKYNFFANEWEWVQAAGGTGDDEGEWISLDRDGDVYVAGYFSGTAYFDPAGANVSVSDNGTGSNAFFAKYANSNGAFQWVQAPTPSGNTASGAGIVTDKSKNVYVSGGYNSNLACGAYSAVPTSPSSGNFVAALGPTPNLGIVPYPNPTYTVTDSYTLPYTITGTFNAGNVYTAQLSDALGSFNSPVNIGNVTATTAGNITITIPCVPAGNYYKIRIISSNPKYSSFDKYNTFISIVNPIIASVSPNANICQDASTTLTASGAGTFTWAPSTSLNTTAGNTVISTPTSPGTITYTVTTTANYNGCFGSSNVSVTAIPLPTITATASPTLMCNGASSTLNASGGTTYTWAPATGLSCTNCASPTASPSTSVTYTITGGSGTCFSTDTLTLHVQPGPLTGINLTTLPPIICGTGSVIITATGGSSYSWTPDPTLSCGTCSNPSADPTITDTYTLTSTVGTCVQPVISTVQVVVSNNSLAGTYTIDNTTPTTWPTARNFHSFREAIAALYCQSAPVIFNVNPTTTYNESNIICYAPGTFSTLFHRDPGFSGTNHPLLLAGTSSPNVGTGTADGFILLQGTDSVTFDGIDLQENAANVTPTTQMEWGYALLRNLATDGAQNCVIKNCVITLNQSNTNTNNGSAANYCGGSCGIYSDIVTPEVPGTQISITSASGANSNNKYYGNTITAHSGIYLYGSTTQQVNVYYYDLNTQVGVPTGNTITNYGTSGGTTQAFGICTLGQNNLSIANNSISMGTGNANNIFGIWTGLTINSSTYIHNNSINPAANNGTSQVVGIQFTTGSVNTGVTSPANQQDTVAIYNNTIGPFNWTTHTSGTFYGIQNISGNPRYLLIHDNTISGVTMPGTGTFYGIYNQATIGTNSIAGVYGGLQVYNNKIQNCSLGGTCYGIYNSTTVGNLSIYNDTLSGITQTRAGYSFYGIYNPGSVPYANSILNIYNNAITNLNSIATSIFYGIYNSGSMTSTAETLNLYNNTLSNLSASFGTFYGIYSQGALSNTNDVANLYNNTLTTTTITGTGQFTGIALGTVGSGSSIVNLSVHGNNVNNISTASVSTNYLFYVGATSGNTTVNNAVYSNNVYNITFTGSGGTTYLLRNDGSNARLIYTNNVYNCKYSSPTSSASMYACYISGLTAGATVNFVYNNTFHDLTTGAGILYGIYNTSASCNNIYGNSIYNLLISGGGTTMYGIYDASTYSPHSVYNNELISLTNKGTGSIYGLYSASAPATENIYNNGIDSLTATSGVIYGIYDPFTPGTALNIYSDTVRSLSNTTGTMYGIFASGTPPTKSVYKNTVHHLISSGATAAGITGIYSGGSTTHNIYNNMVYDLSLSGYTGTTSQVIGIRYLSGTTGNIYNNMVALGNPAPASANTNAVIGLYDAATGGTVANFSYNSVYIAGSSIGANYGSTAFYTTAGATPKLVLINNLVVNHAVPTGTGLAVARRSSSSTTTNFAVAAPYSDYNSYHAGTPGASNLIYYDGTTSDQTLASYQATWSAGGQEAHSISVDPGFTSVSNLHSPFMSVAGAAALVSMGENITAITVDIDGQPRLCPEIGYDEWVACTPLTVSPPTTICQGASTTLTASGATFYTWFPAGSLSSSTGTTVMANPTVTTTYTVTESVYGNTVSTSVGVYPTSVLSITPPNTICAGSQQTLSVLGVSGDSYVWMPAASLSSATGAILTAGPTVSTTYTVIDTDVYGCVSTISTDIGINPLPVLTPSPGVTLCQGFSTSLSCSGAATYAWFPSAGLSTTTGSVVTATPVVPGVNTYTVIGTDASATLCSNSAIIVVDVNASPTANGGFPPTVCQGSPASLSASGGLGYVWSPAAYLSSTTGADVTAFPTVFGSYGYTVTVTDINGCMDNGTVVVSVVSALTANAGNDLSVCGGTNTTLIGLGGAEYSWAPATGLSTTTGNATVFSIAVPGAYSYTLTVSSGICSSTAGVTLTVLSLPTVITSPGATVCLGNATVLTAALLNTATQSITWSPAAGLSSTMGQSIYATPSATTLYTAIGTDGNGCSSVTQANVVVTLNPLPIVSVSPINTAICLGDSAMLVASGITAQLPMSFTWMPAATLSADTGTVVMAYPVTASSYTVVGTDGNGCYNTASDSVSVLQTPVVTISPANASICMGTSTTLTASGATSYTWSPATALDNVNSAVVTASPTAFITYLVTGMNGSCVGKDSVTIGIYTLPTVVVSADATVCSGSSTVLSAAGAVGYVWSPATNPVSGAVVSASPVATTVYMVTGTDGNGCQDGATVVVNVNVPVQVITSPNVTVVSGLSTVISAGNAGVSYFWTGAPLSCDSCQNPTASPTVVTVYSVSMVDANGCSSSATVTVDVSFVCGAIFIPDAFSPNADGYNDVLFVYGVEHNCIDPNSFTFQIFDRWGNMVFESFDPDQPWDGKYKGKELYNDVFVYRLVYAANQTNHSLKGNISLIK